MQQQTSKLHGTLVKWNDSRGFGFIQPDVPGPDVFAHISCFDKKVRRPNEGDPMLYTLSESGDRPQASYARVAHTTVPTPERIAMATAAVGCMVLLLYVTGLASFSLPFVGYLFMSLLTFAVYWADKRRAELGQWRITETALHVLEMLGGWPGGVLAQIALRHKTRKLDYQIIFWTIAAVHVFAWCVLLFPMPGS